MRYGEKSNMEKLENRKQLRHIQLYDIFRWIFFVPGSILGGVVLTFMWGLFGKLSGEGLITDALISPAIFLIGTYFSARWIAPTHKEQAAPILIVVSCIFLLAISLIVFFIDFYALNSEIFTSLTAFNKIQWIVGAVIQISAIVICFKQILGEDKK